MLPSDFMLSFAYPFSAKQDPGAEHRGLVLIIDP